MDFIDKRIVRQHNGVVEAFVVTRIDVVALESTILVRWFGRALPDLSNEVAITISSSDKRLPVGFLPFTYENLNKCIQDAKDELELKARKLLAAYAEEENRDERLETAVIQLEVTGNQYVATEIFTA